MIYYYYSIVLKYQTHGARLYSFLTLPKALGQWYGLEYQELCLSLSMALC